MEHHCSLMDHIMNVVVLDINILSYNETLDCLSALHNFDCHKIAQLVPTSNETIQRVAYKAILPHNMPNKMQCTMLLQY